MSKRIVHIVGTGTIGEPLIGLFSAFKKEFGIDEVTFHKRTPLVDERAKVNAMVRKGATLCTDEQSVAKFEGVQCEACHGINCGTVTTEALIRKRCESCHSGACEHDDGFDWEKDYPLVKHRPPADYVAKEEDRKVLSSLSRQLGAPVGEISARIEKMAKEIKDLRKRAAAAVPALDPFSGEPVAAEGIALHVHLLDQPRDVIGNAAKPIPKKDGGPAGALMVTQHDGKVAAVCALNGAAVEAGFDAVAILRGVGGRGDHRRHSNQKDRTRS